jgi:multiple sugar transport system substrate-binding protein
MAEWTYKAEGSTLLPPRKSLLESPELVEEKPILEGFAQAMECGVSNIIVDPEWGRKEEALNEELGKAMYGEQSAAEALENAAEAAG